MLKNNLGKNLIFIVGMPRSGTTYLLSLLCEHEDYIPLLPSDFGDNRVSCETGCFFHYSDEKIKQVISKKIKDNPKKIIVEKTPFHFMRVKRIKQLFPECKIYVIHRNMGDVYYSMKVSNNVRKYHENTISHFSKILYNFGLFISFNSHIQNKIIDKHFNYEDLLNNPESLIDLFNGSIDINKCLDIYKSCKGGSKIDVAGSFRSGTINSHRILLENDEMVKVFDEINKVTSAINSANLLNWDHYENTLIHDVV